MALTASPACLSDDTVSAWAAGQLTPEALQQAEAHVGFCSYCLGRVSDAARARASAPAKAKCLEDSRAWAELELLAAGNAEGSEAFATAESAEPLVAGRFVRAEFIAHGGMGEVYVGYDRETRRRVAIKQLKRGLSSHVDVIARFAREGEILRRLDHPNIVKTLAVAGGEQQFIVMEYVGGGSLRALLSHGGALPIPYALRLTRQIAGALSSAHELSVVHRDVKPENVLLDEYGTARLTDFGLARMGERSLTAPGTVIGTVAYLSPEVLSGQEADARTDLWALGVMSFEMLTGIHPFAARTPGATLQAILSEPLPDLRALCPHLSLELAALIMRLLERDERRRPQSATEVAAALSA